LNPATQAFAAYQPVRGGLSPAVPIVSSNTNVGTIVGSPAAFAPNVNTVSTPAFDPSGAGTTVVSLTAPAGFSTPSNFQQFTVTVTAPTISIGNQTVGVDLQAGASISLGAAPPNPITVTVTSNNGTIATVSSDGTVAGGATLTFTNVTTTNVGTIFVQGRGRGTTTLTVQATGYTDGTGTVTVDPSGFILNTGDFTTTASAANTALSISTVRLNATTLNFAAYQPLRGGLTASVPIVSSNTTVGTIVGSPAAFAPNVNTVTTAAFNPAAAGTTLVSLTPPTGFSTPSNFQKITVTVNP